MGSAEPGNKKTTQLTSRIKERKERLVYWRRVGAKLITNYSVIKENESFLYGGSNSFDFIKTIILSFKDKENGMKSKQLFVLNEWNGAAVAVEWLMELNERMKSNWTTWNWLEWLNLMEWRPFAERYYSSKASNEKQINEWKNWMSWFGWIGGEPNGE